jgi:predicted N-acetyltransferase YhbS
LVVHPAHRGVGAAKLLTDWGIKLADKSGLDAIVVSVPFARPVYEKCGFMYLKDVEIDFSTPDASEKWKEWQAEDMRAFLMVRPGKQMPNSADSAASCMH